MAYEKLSWCKKRQSAIKSKQHEDFSCKDVVKNKTVQKPNMIIEFAQRYCFSNRCLHVQYIINIINPCCACSYYFFKLAFQPHIPKKGINSMIFLLIRIERDFPYYTIFFESGEACMLLLATAHLI